MKYEIVRTYYNGNPSRVILTGLDMAGVREYLNAPVECPQRREQQDREWSDNFKLEGGR